MPISRAPCECGEHAIGCTEPEQQGKGSGASHCSARRLSGVGDPPTGSPGHAKALADESLASSTTVDDTEKAHAVIRLCGASCKQVHVTSEGIVLERRCALQDGSYSSRHDHRPSLLLRVAKTSHGDISRPYPWHQTSLLKKASMLWCKPSPRSARKSAGNIIQACC